MCGLIGAFSTGRNKKHVNELVLNQFEDQKERGVNGYGIIKINDKMGYKINRATEGYKFMWDIHHNPVRAMIVHHRIPTSSDNTLKQTHPIVVDNGSLKYKYLLVHNGVIRNDVELKKEHEDLGFIYTTIDGAKFNDSECVAIELARFMENQIDMVGIRGSAAFIGLQIDKQTDKVVKLFFGRNEGNPLNLAKTRNKMLLSSTGPGSEVAPFKLYDCKLDAEMKLNRRKIKFAVESELINSPLSSLFDEEKRSAWSSGISKWQANRKSEPIYSHYQVDTMESNYDSDIPIEDGESPLAELIEGSSEAIQTALDGLLDMIYDETSVQYINQEDIELTLEEIKNELTNLLIKAKKTNMEMSLSQESLSGYKV